MAPIPTFDLAEAIKREATEIIYRLFKKRQDLRVSTLALHCAYIASLRALKDSVSKGQMDSFVEMLRQSDNAELACDKKVGIA